MRLNPIVLMWVQVLWILNGRVKYRNHLGHMALTHMDHHLLHVVRKVHDAQLESTLFCLISSFFFLFFHFSFHVSTRTISWLGMVSSVQGITLSRSLCGRNPWGTIRRPKKGWILYNILQLTYHSESPLQTIVGSTVKWTHICKCLVWFQRGVWEKFVGHPSFSPFWRG